MIKSEKTRNSLVICKTEMGEVLMKNMRVSFAKHKKIKVISNVEWYGNIKSDLTIKENPEVFELDFASEVIGKAKEQGSELYMMWHIILMSIWQKNCKKQEMYIVYMQS